MALILPVLALLNQALAQAADGFRDLKAIGDQAEKLRTTATTLRRDLGAAHFDAARLTVEGLRTGSVDREEAGELRTRYEALAARIDAFDAELREVEQELETPAEKRIVRRARGVLDRIGLAVTAATRLLALIETGEDDR